MAPEQAEHVMIGVFLRETAAPDTMEHSPVPAVPHHKQPPPRRGKRVLPLFQTQECTYELFEG